MWIMCKASSRKTSNFKYPFANYSFLPKGKGKNSYVPLASIVFISSFIAAQQLGWDNASPNVLRIEIEYKEVTKHWEQEIDNHMKQRRR